MILYGPPIRIPPNPDSVICAFDLHRVIFHRDWPGIFAYIVRMGHKKDMALLVLNPFFWIQAFRIWRITSVGDEIYDLLVQDYPGLALFKNDFVALENKQKPDQEVVNAVEMLKARGYALYVLSNIGERAYAELRKKFHFLNLFDYVFVVKKSDNYAQKPNPAYYRQFLNLLERNGDAAKSVLFIDDRIPNLESAASVGITGLHFTKKTNLQESLRRIGIL